MFVLRCGVQNMKITKSAFIKEGVNRDRYTQQAIDIDTELRNAIQPILEKYARRGYSIRELAHIANTAIWDVECTWMISSEEYKAQVDE